MEDQNNIQPNDVTNHDTTEAVKSFFKNDLAGMVRQFLSDPLEGTHSFFINRGQHTYFQSLVLIGSVFVLYFIIPYLLMGEARSYLRINEMFSFGMLPVVFMLVISFISFAIKSISGQSNFKDELFTGALNAFPLSFFLILISLGVMFSGDNFLAYMGNLELLFSSLGLMVILVFYILLMMVNILQQSLKASGTKDVLAYYLSPVSVLVAWYVTFKFTENFLH